MVNWVYPSVVIKLRIKLRTSTLKFLNTLLVAFVASAAIFSVQAKPIAESSELVTPLLNGQMLPDVMTKTAEGKSITLASALDNQKTVLFFYRGGWCPYCNTQMGQLKELEPTLKKLGFKLVGISTDAPKDIQKSISKMDLGYQLLSDYDSTVSKAFGLAFFSSQKVTDRYLDKMNLTNPLQKNAAGDERLVLPAPAIYVIDSKGLVQFNYVNPNYKVRLHQDVLLAAAKLVK